MRRWWVLMVAFLLVVAACGGDSSEDGEVDGGNDSPTTQPAEDGGSSSEDSAPPATEADGGDDGDGDTSEGTGESTATVTIGGETYNFTSEGAVVAQCLGDFFGVMSVQLPMLDESGDQTGGIQIAALHEGTDPVEVGEVTSVSVSLGDEDWVADEDDGIYEFYPDVMVDGMSQVDSYEIVGRTVTGSATFVRVGSLSGAPEVVQGTFEATCGEDRIS